MGPHIKAGHMGAPLPYGVRLKSALDRGVVPHMGIPNVPAALQNRTAFRV